LHLIFSSLYHYLFVLNFIIFYYFALLINFHLHAFFIVIFIIILSFYSSIKSLIYIFLLHYPIHLPLSAASLGYLDLLTLLVIISLSTIDDSLIILMYNAILDFFLKFLRQNLLLKLENQMENLSLH
jgi:hypothetical protein